MLKSKFYFAAISFFACLNLLAIETFKDLGTYGNQYEIKEEDAFVNMQKEFKKISKEQIVEAASKASKEVFIAKTDMGNCLVSKDKTFDPTITLKEPIDLSKYGVYIEAGTTFNPLEKGFISSYILFINANDPLQIQLAEQLSQSTSGNLMIIVSNGNMLKVQHLTNEIYKLDTPTINAFHLECVPTVFVQQDKQFFVREFALRKQYGKGL